MTEGILWVVYAAINYTSFAWAIAGVSIVSLVLFSNATKRIGGLGRVIVGTVGVALTGAGVWLLYMIGTIP